MKKRIALEPGQESVWDYPRPPRLEADTRQIRIEHLGQIIADSSRALRVLETSHPPVFYIPGQDINMEYLYPSLSTSWCEFKGRAAYWTVAIGPDEIIDAAWGYPNPVTAYADLAGHFAFYPSKFDTCTVGGVQADSQPGDFYGGWITSEVIGPFKGAPGTAGW